MKRAYIISILITYELDIKNKKVASPFCDVLLFAAYIYQVPDKILLYLD